MELDDLTAFATPREIPGQPLGDVGLAGAGRTLEDDLLLLPDQRFDVLEEIDPHMQLPGQLFQRARWRRLLPIVISTTLWKI